MIPRFRAWIKEEKCFADYIETIRYYAKEVDLCWGGICESDCFDFEDVIFTQSTGLCDKNGEEIFEGDVLKFNDEWAEYCYEGYVDGSVEGVNYVEVVKGEACFEFGKTRYPESSLFIRMEDERLTFAELIKSRDFEFEIIGNVWEDGDLIDGKNTSEN